MTDRECVVLLQWALPRLGLRWRGFSNVRGQVCKRIGRRAKALGLTAAEYRLRVEADPAELSLLDSFCRVTISRFYRDRRVFEHLRGELLPELIEKGRGRCGTVLRCWSAGCASGEEPYSLALVLRLGLAPRYPGLRFEIVATDVDEVLLERARRACYPRAALRDLPVEWQEVAFVASDGERRLRPELREGVELRCEDLRQSMPDGSFELLLCRNLAFTYFDVPLQQAVLGRLVGRLAPGGALLIGAHEQLPPGPAGLERAGALPIFRRT